MEGRTAKQIRDRYIHILRPNIKKGDWTPQEDQHILALYYQFGHKWSKIATLVEGRTEGQVKNRFYSHIKKKLLRDESEPRGSEPHAMEEYTGKSDSAVHGSDFSTTAKTLTRSVMETEVNYTKVEHAVYEDPNNLISYPEYEEQYGYNRHGSRENFLLQQQKAQEEALSRLSSNEANPLVRRLGSNESGTVVRRLVSNESDLNVVRRGFSGEQKFSHQGSAETFEGVPPSPLTNYSTFSRVRNEKDVDVILDRMTMFFNKSTSPQVNQEGEYLDEKDLELLKKEKNDQLQKRKAALEFLLMKTMEEMTGVNGPTGVMPH